MDIGGQRDEGLEKGGDLLGAGVDAPGVHDPESGAEVDVVDGLVRVEAVGDDRRRRRKPRVEPAQVGGHGLVDGRHRARLRERPGLEPHVQRLVAARRVVAELVGAPGVAVVGHPGQAAAAGQRGRHEVRRAPRMAREERVEAFVAQQPPAGEHRRRHPADVGVGHLQPVIDGTAPAGLETLAAGRRGRSGRRPARAHGPRELAGQMVDGLGVEPGGALDAHTGRIGHRPGRANGQDSGLPAELGQIAYEAQVARVAAARHRREGVGDVEKAFHGDHRRMPPILPAGTAPSGRCACRLTRRHQARTSPYGCGVTPVTG